MSSFIWSTDYRKNVFIATNPDFRILNREFIVEVVISNARVELIYDWNISFMFAIDISKEVGLKDFMLVGGKLEKGWNENVFRISIELVIKDIIRTLNHSFSKKSSF